MEITVTGQRNFLAEFKVKAAAVRPDIGWEFLGFRSPKRRKFDEACQEVENAVMDLIQKMETGSGQ